MSKHRFAPAAALALLLAAPAAHAQDWKLLEQGCLGSAGTDAEAGIGACTKLIESGRYKGAELASYHLARGFAHYDLRRFELAVREYDAALGLEPGNATAHLHRGNAYDQLGEYARALADYDAVLRLKADDPAARAVALNNRCYTRVGLGQLDVALADCNGSLALKGDAPDTLASRGLVYFRMGRLDAAMADFAAALKLAPEHPDALYGRGVLRRKAGDEAGGAADIETARKLEPYAVEELAKRGLK